MPKKKGKGKKVELATDAASLKPFGVEVNDIIQTPLGVECTVVGLNVGEGVLVLKWPGDSQSAMPSKCKTKADMEAFGYHRKPQQRRPSNAALGLRTARPQRYARSH